MGNQHGHGRELEKFAQGAILLNPGSECTVDHPSFYGQKNYQITIYKNTMDGFQIAWEVVQDLLLTKKLEPTAKLMQLKGRFERLVSSFGMAGTVEERRTMFFEAAYLCRTFARIGMLSVEIEVVDKSTEWAPGTEPKEDKQ